MKISRTITSMFSLALPLDFAVTSEGKTRHAPLLFSPFSTAGTDCLCKEKSRNLKTYFKALRQRGHHATPFRLRYASCKAVALLKVTLGKSAILPRFITLFWVQRHAARNVCEAPLCGCISKHFTFARKICSHTARSYPRKNFTFCARVHDFALCLLCPCAGHQGAASRCLPYCQGAFVQRRA